MIQNIIIVLGSDRSQGIFRAICKFIMRDECRINMNDYSIKSVHVDHEKGTYKIL